MNKQISRNSDPVFSQQLKTAARWCLWKASDETWGNILIPRQDAFSAATGQRISEPSDGNFGNYEITRNQFMQDSSYDGLGILAGAGIVVVELSDCVDPDGKIVGRAAEVVHRVPTLWMHAIEPSGVVGLFRGKPDPDLEGMHPMLFVASEKYPCCLSGTPVPGSSPELADWNTAKSIIREVYALLPSGDHAEPFAWEPQAEQAPPPESSKPPEPLPSEPEPRSDPVPIAIPAPTDRSLRGGHGIPNEPPSPRQSSVSTTTELEALGTPLRIIVVNDRELPDVASDCIQALIEQNDPPKIYRRAGELVRVVSDENGTLFIEPMSASAFRGHLARSAMFRGRHWDQSGRQNVEIPSTPPLDLVRDVMALTPTQFPVPALRGILRAPGFRADGSLILTPGYDPPTGLYYAPSSDLKGLKIPDQPSQSDARLAAELLQEVVADFPFVGQSDRANCLALLVTPSIRSLMQNVPLFVLTAPQQGSGKTLIAEEVSIIHTGKDAVMLTAPKPNSDEWSKLLAAQLMAGRPLSIFDNCSGKFESDALATILTAGEYEARMLGRTEVRSFPQQTIFIVTGNNVTLGEDLSRRSVLTRLNAQTSTPYRRTGFRHPDLKEWTRERRQQLVVAILVLVRAWFVAGRPESSTPIIGSFEQWCKTVGGVLAYAGVEGFLDNFDATSQQSDLGSMEWEAFLYAILSQRPQAAGTMDAIESREFTTRDVADLIRGVPALREVLPDELAESVRRENPQALARGLSKIAERRFGEESIFVTKLPHLNRSGVAIWKIRVGNPVNR
jgi:hypothetical protein